MEKQRKIIMTITYAVWGCGDLDTMEIAIVFNAVLHESHINEAHFDVRELMSHGILCAW